MKKFSLPHFVVIIAAFGCLQVISSHVHAETTSASTPVSHCLTASGSTGVYSISAPIAINAPGTYYLTQDIVQTAPNTDAIDVVPASGMMSGVTIDLNGHTISTYPSGGSVNPATNCTGIYTNATNNVTVRNGTISGFLFGVYTANGNTSGHCIENLRLNNNTCVAIYINAPNSVVRRCQIDNTGGSTLSTIGPCHGIYVGFANNMVIDCDVASVVGCQGAAGSGITFVSTPDGVALNNRVSKTNLGLWFEGTCTVKYRDNLFGASITTPVSGSSIDAGGNF